MNLTEYQELQKTTCADLGSHTLNVSHMMLGIVGEWQEIEDAPHSMFLEEVGDEIWYIVGLANFLNIKVAVSGHVVGSEKKLIALLAENVKKYIAYGKPLPTTNMAIWLSSLITVLQAALWGMDMTLEECLEYNIIKLQKRYPKGFTQNDAIVKKDEQR